jgi:hypothetical protein
VSTQLKKINVVGEYVAVMRAINMPEGIAVDQQAMEKLSNEGVVVGIGPEVDFMNVSLGDRVILLKKTYLTMCPASGGYEGKYVTIVKKSDIVVKIGKDEEYTVS